MDTYEVLARDKGANEAQIKECSRLEVSQGGTFVGTAQVDEAEISGTFEGDLTARRVIVIGVFGLQTLALVFLLYVYHLSLQVVFNQLRKGIVRYTSQQMRLWNEVSTLFLISIVFLIVLKNALSMVWGLAGLVVVTALIMAGMVIYKKIRKDK